MEASKIIVKDDLIEALYPNTCKIILTLDKEDIAEIKSAITTLWEQFYENNKSSSFSYKIVDLLTGIVDEAEK